MKHNIIKKNLLRTYYNTLNSLVHVGTITHKEEKELIERLDEIVYLSGELTKREECERLLFKFRQNNPKLIKEYAEYRNSQISNGINLSINFDLWLLRFKHIDYKNFKIKELKGGIKTNGI